MKNLNQLFMTTTLLFSKQKNYVTRPDMHIITHRQMRPLQIKSSDRIRARKKNTITVFVKEEKKLNLHQQRLEKTQRKLERGPTSRKKWSLKIISRNKWLENLVASKRVYRFVTETSEKQA